VSLTPRSTLEELEDEDEEGDSEAEDSEEYELIVADDEEDTAGPDGGGRLDQVLRRFGGI